MRFRVALAHLLVLAMTAAGLLGCGEDPTVTGPQDVANVDSNGLDAGCSGAQCLSCGPDDDGAPCDDGDPCTGGDHCQSGSCVGASEVCTCRSDADCEDPDDDRCTGVPYCDTSVAGHACKPNPGTAVSCGEGTPCAPNACDPATGACTAHPELAKGQSCDDGELCTTAACDGAGSCVATGRAPDCACSSDADCAAKDDGNACNGTLFCDKSGPTFSCATKPNTVVVCPQPSAPCTVVACEPTSGACVTSPAAENSACDDGKACTEGDHCVAGGCVAGTSTCPCSSDADCLGQEDGNLCNGTLFCDKALSKCVVNPATVVVCPPTDAGACVSNVCVGKTGACIKELAKEGAACEDGDGCTAGEHCQSGICGGGLATCQCDEDADCAKYEDGDVCNGTLYCDPQAGSCVVNPATVVLCPEPADPACQTAQCNPKDGACTLADALTGTTCSDGNACTAGDGCVDGACTAGAILLCPCKEDADCAKFEDGDLCNGTLFCDLSAVQDGGAPACKLNAATVVQCPPASSSCTANLCVGKTGLCAATVAADGSACDDGDPCTGADACSGGSCGGVALSCDDGDPCTDDACAAKSGGCGHKAKGCDDGESCTVDACDPTTGVCTHLVPTGGKVQPCDDGDACTWGDACSAAGCKGKPALCTDNDPCTADACAPESGTCTHAPQPGAACDDGDACTWGDACAGGGCVGLPLASTACADSDACTADGCHPLVGCLHVAAGGAPCDDGEPCTTGDVCGPTGGCSGKPDLSGAGCDDGNACTLDGCQAGLGCTHKALGLPGGASASCDDGDPCSKDDACVAGSCEGQPAGCACKVDADCAIFDDGDLCNGTLRCDTASFPFSCKVDPQTVVQCPADGPCAVSSCAPKTGACSKVVAADGSVCAPDGKACTVGSCSAGVCGNLGGKDCDDGNACTVDACQDAIGCVHQGAALDGKACDDGDPCSKGELCKAGVCDPALATPACDDGNACTLDLCDGKAGCLHPAGALDGKVCDDGDACSLGELCQGESCKGGTAKNCDDGNACTNDACKGGSCQHSASGAPCDDGDPCTNSDACKSGLCAGKALPCGDGNPCTVDFCLPSLGCVHDAATLEGKLCVHPSGCVVGASCKAGACQGGDASGCGDIGDCSVDPDALFFSSGAAAGWVSARFDDAGRTHSISSSNAPLLWMYAVFDADGTQIGATTYTPPGKATLAQAVVPLSDGGALLGGGTNPESGTAWQKWQSRVLRVDAAGKVLWTDGPGTANGYFRAGVLRPDGTAVMVAHPSSNSQATFVAMTTAGAKVWSKIYKGNSGTYYKDSFDILNLRAESDGGMLATGRLANPSFDSTAQLRALLVRLDKNGNRTWWTSVNVGYQGGFTDVIRRADGSLLAVGFGRAVAGAPYLGFFGTASSSGGGAKAFQVDPDSKDVVFTGVLGLGADVLVSAYDYDTGYGGYKVTLARRRSDGTAVWQRVYTVKSSSTPAYGALTTAAAGGYRLAGSTATSAPGGNIAQTLVIRTDPWGHAPCSAAGLCSGKKQAGCDDGDGCTTDICDAAKGCVHVAIPGCN
ncbi:MAG: hypothetical protein H6747_14010 [Deltaproteobacteria bacterium]|nr:hypothetical protein [Deltaproteobacteria bacterium]